MCPLKNNTYKHMKKALLFLTVICFLSCKETIIEKDLVVKTNEDKFVFASWAHEGGTFNASKWETKLASYDSLGITELL
ncbi:MAG: hypothetical protein ACI9SD_001458, partial [Pseudohongiellaceae bacterium]